MFDDVAEVRAQLADLVDALDPDLVPAEQAEQLWRALDRVERLAAASKTLLGRPAEPARTPIPPHTGIHSASTLVRGDRTPLADLTDTTAEVVMIDTRTLAWLDHADAWIAETIRTHGWAIQYVGGDECSVPGCDCREGSETPFAYTVGLVGMGHPELLIFGVPPATAAMVLNTLGERIRGGANLVPGQLITYAGWPRIVVEDVPNPGEIVFSANRHFRRPPGQSVPVLQLSYEDDNGRFPWEQGFAQPATQPRPGTFRAGASPTRRAPD